MNMWLFNLIDTNHNFFFNSIQQLLYDVPVSMQINIEYEKINILQEFTLIEEMEDVYNALNQNTEYIKYFNRDTNTHTCGFMKQRDANAYFKEQVMKVTTCSDM